MPDQIILIADDDDNDVFLLKRALEASGIRNQTRVVTNGEDVICYLKGEGPYSNRIKHPFPILLILNLQMPRKTGGEVLAWMQSQESLPKLKLIVLTGTLDPRQARQAVHLGAERFLSKPPDSGELIALLRGMEGIELKPEGGGFRLQFPAALLAAGMCLN